MKAGGTLQYARRYFTWTKIFLDIQNVKLPDGFGNERFWNEIRKRRNRRERKVGIMYSRTGEECAKETNFITAVSFPSTQIRDVKRNDKSISDVLGKGAQRTLWISRGKVITLIRKLCITTRNTDFALFLADIIRAVYFKKEISPMP